MAVQTMLAKLAGQILHILIILMYLLSIMLPTAIGYVYYKNIKREMYLLQNFM